jgi:hypothetical protein
MDLSKKNILIALGLITFFFLGYYLKFEDKENVVEFQGEEVKEEQALDLYVLKSQADELFIQQNFDAALELYGKLAEHTHDSSLLQNRVGILAKRRKTETLIENISDNLVKKEKLITLLEHCPDFVVKYGKNQAMKLDDEILLDYTLICFQNLQQVAYHSLSTLENIEEKNVLEFLSPKGAKVHYLGVVKDGGANGHGTGIWDTGGIYEGEWKDNKRHGKGYHQSKNGEYYDGEWFEDKRTGKGIFTWRNGDYYVGEWKDNKRSGFGTVISVKGDTLVHGYWDNDSFDRRRTREKADKIPVSEVAVDTQ